MSDTQPIPKASGDQKKEAWRALQRLWVAGTMGAFFTAFARNLPGHLGQIGWPIDVGYTLNIYLRYGYLLWLLLYFFASNLRVQSRGNEPDRHDILFDVVQSASALTAAYFLDFITTSEHRGVAVFAWPNAAIIVISGLALCLFKGDGKQTIRVAGFLLALVSATFAILGTNHPSKVMGALTVLLALLFVVLWRFIGVRVRSIQVPPASV